MEAKLHPISIARNKEIDKLRKFYGLRCMNIECINKTNKEIVDNFDLKTKKPIIKIISYPSNKNLEFAHIQRTNLSGMGRGKSARIKDIKKNPKCYVLLCHECHQYLDAISDQEERKKLIIQINRRKIEILQLRYLESVLMKKRLSDDIEKYLNNVKELMNINFIFNHNIQKQKKIMIKMINGYLS